ncbi:MAG: ATPase domain-containing protein [Asgard group archaeon]|nr:ATPase domain-containing protein [Asgard group archaeon]
MEFQRIAPSSSTPKQEKASLQKSGLAGFDATIGGGIPDGSLILLLGEPGAGHTIFSMQMMFNQAKEGRKVYYVSVDKPTTEVDMEMLTFGWDISTYKSIGSWTYIDAYGAKFASTDEATPVISFDKGLLNLLRTKFINHVAKTNQPFTIVDSLSHLLLDYDVEQVRDLIENFTTKVVRKVGGVHLLLMVKGMHDPQTEVLFSHIADGVIDFYMRERSDQLQRTFRVRKMRKAIYDTRLYPVNLEEDGLQIETARRL